MLGQEIALHRFERHLREGTNMKVKRLNRIELLMPRTQIDAAVKTFSDLLGVDIKPPRHLKEHRVLSTTCWEAGIELLAPSDDDALMSTHLARQSPPCFGPIVWEVSSISDIRDYAKQNGIGIVFEEDFGEGGRQLCLDSKDCLGYTATFTEGPIHPPLGPKAQITGLNRIEMLFPKDDLENARRFYGGLLGIAFPPFKLLTEHHNTLTTVSWEAGLELFGPGASDGPLIEMLKQKGGRGVIGPIVWNVADLEKCRRHALSLGHKVVYEFELEWNGRTAHQLNLHPDTLFGYQATFTHIT
jgi:hypothetical protein